MWIGAAVLFGSSIFLTACQAFFMTVLDGEFIGEVSGVHAAAGWAGWQG